MSERISAKERMPKGDQPVLVLVNPGKGMRWIDISYFHEECNEWQRYDTKDVEYWTEIPEMP